MFYCTLCHLPSPVNQQLCEPCFLGLPWNHHSCPRCATPMTENTSELCLQCQREEPYIDHCVAPLLYRFPIDQLILRGKGGKRPDLLLTLSRWLADQLPSNPKPDLLIPVPLLAAKQVDRGYNQAGLIASYLSKRLKIPVRHDIVLRIRETAEQKRLSKYQRASNLERAFRIQRANLRQLQPKASYVAVVDDVVTTGSTSNQIAKQLLRAGVERVDTWALAKTPDQLTKVRG